MKKILIVEDDLDIATTLQDRLGMLGFKTVTAHDGVSALEQLESAEPDLMLLDLHLPRLSGLEVLEKLAARRAQGCRSPDVPVVIMSAFLEAKSAVLALDAGVRAFVGKPFQWNEFFAIMEQAIKAEATQPASDALADGDRP